MSEIKGIDQIFPKKSPAEGAKSNLKLWVVAGVVAAIAAGYAFVPTASSTPTIQTLRPGAAALPSLPMPVQPTAVAKPSAEKKPVVVEDGGRTSRKADIPKQRIEVAQSAPEVKAAVKSPGRSCDCESAELSLPSVCPDASCHQCKASCGIPGN